MKGIHALCLSLFFLSCQAPHNDSITITNASVIDVESGNIKAYDILIQDSSIVLMAEANSLNKGSGYHIDGSGYYLMPGLWDMHVHLQDSSYLPLFLDYGVTDVRDMGGCVGTATDGCESLCPDILNRWKAAMKAGRLDGPDLYIAGTQLSGTGWPTSFPVSSKEEIEAAFAQNLQDQVDFVKVY